MAIAKNQKQLVHLLGIEAQDNWGGTEITVYTQRALAELHLKRYVWENWINVFSEMQDDFNYKLRPETPEEVKMADVWEFQSMSSETGGAMETFKIQRQPVLTECEYKIEEPRETKECPIDSQNWVDIEPTETDGEFNLYLKGIDMDSFSSQLRRLQAITHNVKDSGARLDIMDMMDDILKKYRKEYNPTETITDDILMIPYKVTESAEKGNLEFSLNLRPLVSTQVQLDDDLRTCMKGSDGVILFHNEKFTKVEQDFSQWPLHGSSTVGGTSFFEILRICEKQLNRKF